MDVTALSLELGIGEAVAGRSLADVARAIETEVETNGFSVVRQFVGHGIGTELHEDPHVPNYAQDAPRLKLREGMVLAIEPMVSAGSYEVRPAAHFEHTVVVMENEADVLTELPSDCES